MTYPNMRSGRPAAPHTAGSHAPHAALLIDFDNVTLGIRSDLTKELRTLLNSDIIKGKVAVQRAYADWRRYPQYIVPLSEASIDLIFAPAFGTNKKNATDIRLAVDAIELVFIRPEIGTFILLSGDSDFSTMVIKLKEYGKYVIGVGIRESASDLLIQNCDEYYSYNDLAGLTREVDAPSIQRDPWQLVTDAVATMMQNRDVMRSDRLKQVMQQLDPNFDEKNAGFNRFSKFVSEAANRHLIRVSKQENGQYEISPGEARSAPAPSAAAAPAEEERRGRSRRGRGRGREERGKTEEKGRDRDPGAGRRSAEAAAPRDGQLSLATAFHLLTRALGDMKAPVPQEMLRERMIALHGRPDALLDASRFSRLLRQANDAEVADVRMLPDESFEVSPHRTDLALAMSARRTEGPPAPAAEPAVEEAAPAAPAAPSAAAKPAGLRFRRGSRGPQRPPDAPLVGVVKSAPEAAPVAPAAEDPPKKPVRKRSGASRRSKSGGAKKEASAEDTKAKSPATAQKESEAGPARTARKKARKKPVKKGTSSS